MANPACLSGHVVVPSRRRTLAALGLYVFIVQVREPKIFYCIQYRRPLKVCRKATAQLRATIPLGDNNAFASKGGTKEPVKDQRKDGTKIHTHHSFLWGKGKALQLSQ
jgi:hypothetical protein